MDHFSEFIFKISSSIQEEVIFSDDNSSIHQKNYEISSAFPSEEIIIPNFFQSSINSNSIVSVLQETGFF